MRVGTVRVLAEPLQRQSALAGAGDDGLLREAVGQFDERVQAGGDPRDPDPWGVATERRHQPVPPASVDQTRSPDVAVVGA